jgi:cell division protein FtsI/penicillin-binding protein 2
VNAVKDTTAPADWRDTLRKRTMITAIFIAAWMVGIEARLVVLQVVRSKDLSKIAARQQMSRSNAAAKRGDILDRRGQVLATSVSADSIYAVPSAIEDPTAVVGALCKIFGDCTGKERTCAATCRPTRRARSRRSISRASASSRKIAGSIRTRSSRRICSATSGSTTRA